MPWNHWSAERLGIALAVLAALLAGALHYFDVLIA